MAMLAERVDGARRRRHPPRAPWPPRRSPRSVACSPRPPPAPMRPATSSCSASPAARCLAAAGGQWKARAATAPAWRRSCSSAANASWSRPTQAAGVPHRCQQRRLDAVRPRPRGTWPGAPGQVRGVAASGKRCGRCLPPALRHPGQVAAIGERKALIVGAPEELRAELRGASTATQIQRCASSEPDRPARSEHQLTVRALRTTAGAHPVPGRRGRPAPRASAPP
jgi:hypothetical protein